MLRYKLIFPCTDKHFKAMPLTRLATLLCYCPKQHPDNHLNINPSHEGILGNENVHKDYMKATEAQAP